MKKFLVFTCCCWLNTVLAADFSTSVDGTGVVGHELSSVLAAPLPTTNPDKTVSLLKTRPESADHTLRRSVDNKAQTGLEFDGSLRQDPPVNDDCQNAEYISGPCPQHVSGTIAGATLDCPGVLDWNGIWYEIEFPYTRNNLQVSYCGTVPAIASIAPTIHGSCSDCPDYLIGVDEWGTCGDGNPTLSWSNIAGPRTVMLPVFMTGASEFELDICVEQYTVPADECPFSTDCANVDLTISRVDEDVLLSWPPLAEAMDYKVYSSTENAYGGFTELSTSTAGMTTYLDAGVATTGQRYYKVSAVCQTMEFSLEQEAPCADTNGGCSLESGAMEEISEGQLVCGTMWRDAGMRDTDWYEIVLEENSTITITLVPGEIMPMTAHLIRAASNDVNCRDEEIISTVHAQPGSDPVTITTPCLAADQDYIWDRYALFVASQQFIDLEIPCDPAAPIHYGISYTTAPCPDPYPNCDGPRTYEEAHLIDALPFTYSGSTEGCLNTIALSDTSNLICSWDEHYTGGSVAADHWFKLSLAEPAVLDIELCATGHNSTIGVFLDHGVMPALNDLIWGNEDRDEYSSECFWSARAKGCPLPAGDYVIVVTGRYEDGAYDLRVDTVVEEIAFHSGNGPVGGWDTQISLRSHVTAGPFNYSFAFSDFSDARNGPDAAIISPEFDWLQALPADSTAHWVTNSGFFGGNSALYAIEFEVTSDPIDVAQLDLYYAAKDGLGLGQNQEIYLNMMPLPGAPGGGPAFQSHLSLEVGSMLFPGSNWLYFNVSNVNNQNSGLLFSGTLQVQAGQP